MLITGLELYPAKDQTRLGLDNESSRVDVGEEGSVHVRVRVLHPRGDLERAEVHVGRQRRQAERQDDLLVHVLAEKVRERQRVVLRIPGTSYR